MSAPSPAPQLHKVKRYSCLYTDQVNKKHKSYKDGFIRHHHYNNRLFLLSESQAVLSQTFYEPVKPTALPLPDSFQLAEEEELDFEGFLAKVEAFEWDSETNVANLRDKVKKPEDALAWGQALDGSVPRARPSPLQASTSSSRSGVGSQLIGAKPAYKGFGVRPPSTYAPGEPAPKKRRTKGSPPPASPKPLPAGGRPTTSDANDTPTARRTGPAATPSPSSAASSSSRMGPVFHSNQRFPKGHPNHIPLGSSPYSKPAASSPSAAASFATMPQLATPRSAGPVKGADFSKRDSVLEADVQSLKSALQLKELAGVSTPSKGALSPFKMPRPGGGAVGAARGTPSRLGRA